MILGHVLARVDRLLLASVIAASVLLGGCTTEYASQPSAALGNFEMTNNVLDTNISVDTSRKLTGEAEESVFLGFIPLTSPVRCAVGVAYNPGGGGAWTGDLPARLARIRAAAAYNAVVGKADILVAPQWSVTEEDSLFVTKYRARVSGYPGTIKSITNNAYSNLPVSAQRAYEDAQRIKERACCVPNCKTCAGGSVAASPTPVSMNSSDAVIASTGSDAPPSLGAVLDQADIGGAVAERGDLVRYHYTCSLEDGRVVFDSRERGAPRSRPAGATDTPSGLGQALVGMRAGDHRRVTLPPAEAFGSAGMPNLGIPPGATVVFDIYVDGVSKR